MSAQTLKRIMASGFIVAGGAAIFTWVWPEDGSFLLGTLAVLSAVLSVVVVVSLWQK